MVKKLVVNKVFSDTEMKEMEGTWIDESYIKHPVINDNTDVYYIDDNGDEKLLLKFRKGVITDNELRIGWQAYKDLAKPSRGRGASAGPIDLSGQYWSKRIVVNNQKWMTNYLKPVGKELKEKYDQMTDDELKTIAANTKKNIIKNSKSLNKNRQNAIRLGNAVADDDEEEEAEEGEHCEKYPNACKDQQPYPRGPSASKVKSIMN